ncbi:MAG: PQQ-binding-like beta-propeller repeat protein [Planctomycetia bacterium]|nr:PQQ-binding-like beta-propeller repeat protein [Planctomycetia bacterium]
MRRSLICTTLLLMCVSPIRAADWLHFRGSDNRSVAADGHLPSAIAKDEAGTEHNVAWKVPVPGRAVASPIVVRDNVIVTSASGYSQDRLHVLCFDATSGKLRWERQFWATGRTLCHPTSSVAAPSPASDGRRIFALFSSNDLACLDLDGNLLWYRGLTHDYPTAANDVGMSSSPVVVGDTVVVQVETKGDSFAAGLYANTGETRWKIPRQADMNWTSPAVLPGRTRGEDAVLLQSPGRITANNARTGEQVWTYEVACSSIPSPVADGGIVFVPAAGLTALRHQPDAKAAEVLWSSNALAPGSASAIVHQGRVYAINGSGVLLCGDATTGDVLWKLRLKGPFWATPVIAGDRLLAVSQEGHAQIVQLGDKSGEIIAQGDLGEPVFGTPAVADGAVYVRSDGHLWKIAEK